ncbi:MAG: hypothetical protein AB1640_13000 [bacterium]
MNDLREVTRDPAFLEKLGFARRDQNSTDVVRWVWYERTIDSIGSQVRFVVQVEFELCISDDPFVKFPDNHTYSFSRVYLKVIDRQMEREDNRTYDEDTEIARVVDRFEINVTKVSQLRVLCRMLSWEK